MHFLYKAIEIPKYFRTLNKYIETIVVFEKAFSWFCGLSYFAIRVKQKQVKMSLSLFLSLVQWRKQLANAIRF